MRVDISELDKEQAGEAWRIYVYHYNYSSRGVDEHRVPAEIAAWLSRKASAERIKALEAEVRELKEAITATKHLTISDAYLAGARMARERERERGLFIAWLAIWAVPLLYFIWTKGVMG